MLLSIAGSMLAGYTLTLRSNLQQLADAARTRLDVAFARLEGESRRFDYLPALLGTMPAVARLLGAPDDLRLREEVNRQLRVVNATAGASNLYLLDAQGRGLAASDWDDPGTPVGADLSFRPYLTDALAFGRGSFYGVGITSGRPGQYLAYAIDGDRQSRGVATVKIDLEGVEQAWSQLPGIMLVVDERGVVILSTRAAWKFRPLLPLTPQWRADIATTKPYGAAPLTPLPWRSRQRPAEDVEIADVAGVRYLATSRRVDRDAWRLLVLDETAAAQATARLAAMAAALGVAVVWLLGQVLRQRRRARRQQARSRQALQAAHDGLETLVEQRTAQLRGLNARLGDEIETRKRVEADLRATQGDLVHAGKMSALGQMSAALVHEINQPLGALRTLSDNAGVLLEQQRLDEVRGNLQRIAHVVDRLGRLVQPLKTFAHKSAAPRRPVELQLAVAQAQLVVAPRLSEHGVVFEVSIRPQQLAVLADEARLEQVLANLFANAVDAMVSSPLRRLRVDAGIDRGRCIIVVGDTGSGIDAAIRPRLFEPFATTRPAGSGLGLGLTISAHIVREFGGTLAVDHPAAGGACFLIELPLAGPAPGAPP